MPYEMRRPGTIDINTYVVAWDARLRAEVPRIKRRVVPATLRHPFNALKTITKPILQGGALVLTALSIILAVGVAPATVTPGHTNTQLAAPSISEQVYPGASELEVRLQALNVLAIQEPDIPDTARANLE